LRPLVLAAALFCFCAGAVTELQPAAPATPDRAHTILTSFTGASVVNADPTHLKRFALHECPSDNAAAIEAQFVPSLMTIGALASLAAVAGWIVDRVLDSKRDPPREVPVKTSGHELLTRVCIARR